MASVESSLPNSGGIQIHNNLQGLNEGDYIHLTQVEKLKLNEIDNKQPIENQRLSTTNDVEFNSLHATNSATIQALNVGDNSETSSGDIVVRNDSSGSYGRASKNTLKNIIGIGGDFVSQQSGIIFQGDSMTVGISPATPYPDLVSTDNTYSKLNHGVGGKTIATMESEAPTIDDVLYRFNARENVYVIWGGTNDLATGATVETTFDLLQATCRERRNKGFKVIVLTTLKRCGNNPSGTPLSDLIPVYNALIRESWSTFADGIADIASDPTLFAQNPCIDTVYYNGDGIHLTTAGNTLVANIVSEEINKISKVNSVQDLEIRGNVIKPITIEKDFGTSETAVTIRNTSALNGNLEKILFEAWNVGFGYSPVASIEAVSNGASIGQSKLYFKVAQHGGTGALNAMYIDGVDGKIYTVNTDNYETDVSANFTGLSKINRDYADTRYPVYQTGLNTNLADYILGFDSTTGYWRPSTKTQVQVFLEVKRVVPNSTTSALSASALNSVYSSFTTGDKVQCLNISGGGLIYEKTDSGWCQYSAIIVL